ncbi:cupredoxin domain-containing protein [Roseibium salinum]|uniref:Cupredoxin family protein n=1 Tax=Roseibium salinum TaxID=1604349 RepID=A0ABT3QZZ1_9HYPH|nr:cupredoxin family protein [Roseibium sp. DSM 29163]MCX2722477.1 cupredoxin family protein [Roseibium sp. DSM 29163]MDN3719557.1 cupredoxin family protein [Roseibium salinum]
MRYLAMAVVSMALFASAAHAAGSHSGGHGHGDAEMMAIGKPGDAAAVTRIVTITMLENEDGAMLFEPASLSVKEGETLRLKYVNAGETEHEFVMDVHDSLMEHKKLMARFPEMEHDDPNAVRLAPGDEGEIVWTFSKAGDFEFACLIPGHYESGMKGRLTVDH